MPAFIGKTFLSVFLLSLISEMGRIYKSSSVFFLHFHSYLVIVLQCRLFLRISIASVCAFVIYFLAFESLNL